MGHRFFNILLIAGANFLLIVTGATVGMAATIMSAQADAGKVVAAGDPAPSATVSFVDRNLGTISTH